MATATIRAAVIGVLSALSIGSLGGCGEGPAKVPPTPRVAALSLPNPGQTIVLDFKTDAAGNPLTRGTVLAEQYAAWGIHFANGFVLGDLTVDFPDYEDTAPDNLICTHDASIDDPNLVSWVDGRCAGGPPTGDVPLVMNLDFPACYVSIEGDALAVKLQENFGRLALSGTDSTGATKGSFATHDIINLAFLSGSTFMYFAQGVGLAAIPSFPSSAEANEGTPMKGLDVRQVNFEEQNLGAFDNITIIACDEVIAGGGGGAGGGGSGTGLGGNAGGGGGPAGSGGATHAGGQSGTGGGSPGTGGVRGTGGSVASGGTSGGGAGGTTGPGAGGTTGPGVGGTIGSAGGADSNGGGGATAPGVGGRGASGPGGTTGDNGGAVGTGGPGTGGSAPQDSGVDHGSSPDAGAGGFGPRSGCDIGASEGQGPLSLMSFALALALARRRARPDAISRS